MSQSTYIAAALLACFVLYLAAKNRLSAYTAVLWGATAQTPPAGPSSKSSGSSSGSGVAGVGLGTFGSDFGGGSGGGSSTMGTAVQVASIAAMA